MVAYKCKKCGVVSPHKKRCFRCGCTEKDIVRIPNKKKKDKVGNYILSIGI